MSRVLLASLVLVFACTTEDTPSMSSGGATETNGTAPADCGSFTTAESCPEPCSWRTYATYADATTSCDPGDDVSLCVYESGDVAQGCGLVDGCDDTWGYIELADGTRAMATYCGGTPPEAWTTCGPDDIAGGIPECACACPGAGGSSGDGGSSSSGG